MLRGTGSLSAERKEYLENLGNQLGLPEEERNKIIREARTEVLGAAAALDSEERWTVDKVGLPGGMVCVLHGEWLDITVLPAVLRSSAASASCASHAVVFGRRFAACTDLLHADRCLSAGASDAQGGCHHQQDA